MARIEPNTIGFESYGGHLRLHPTVPAGMPRTLTSPRCYDNPRSWGLFRCSRRRTNVQFSGVLDPGDNPRCGPVPVWDTARVKHHAQGKFYVLGCPEGTRRVRRSGQTSDGVAILCNHLVV